MPLTNGQALTTNSAGVTGWVTLPVGNVVGTNIFLNATAGNNSLTGNDNISCGIGASTALTSGNRNITLGTNAGTNLTTSTSSSDNVLIGYNAGQYGGNSGCVVVGSRTMDTGTAGNNQLCTVVGYESMRSSVNSLENTCVGSGSMNNTTGTANLGLGYNCMSTNVGGSNIVCVGAGSDVVSSALTNAIALGSGAIVQSSNSMQLGNSSLLDVFTYATINPANVNVSSGGFVLTPTLNVAGTDCTPVNTTLSSTWEGPFSIASNIMFNKFGKMCVMAVQAVFGPCIVTSNSTYSLKVPSGYMPSTFYYSGPGLPVPLQIAFGVTNSSAPAPGTIQIFNDGTITINVISSSGAFQTSYNAGWANTSVTWFTD